MTGEEAIKVLEMFLHKQCDLKRTEFAYDQNTVWEAVYMASKALDKCNKIEYIITDWDDVPWCKSNTVMQVTLIKIADVLEKEKE